REHHDGQRGDGGHGPATGNPNLQCLGPQHLQLIQHGFHRCRSCIPSNQVVCTEPMAGSAFISPPKDSCSGLGSCSGARGAVVLAAVEPGLVSELSTSLSGVLLS